MLFKGMTLKRKVGIAVAVFGGAVSLFNQTAGTFTVIVGILIYWPAVLDRLAERRPAKRKDGI